MLRQEQTELVIKTQGQNLYEFTYDLENWLLQIQASVGQVTLFCRHTSCSLTIQENADPDVKTDLTNFFKRYVPENEPWYKHTCEGPDDMPAHIKSALTDVSLTIPVSHGRSVLGTWQGIYLFEHRHAPHHRKVILHYAGG
ncbi:secondary thiamine-phosphate synthase enzyme YjbQ [Curvivirga sp.]|uniref:secondary thiamine-phosphate synthase enzyme YjbQ n=1 Tax=Curvivirga sp. TaxID=2856848 RepID=UPI003B5B9A77